MKKGLYIHIPFCSSKCDYCDFYSFVPAEKETDSYLSAVLSSVEKWGRRVSGSFDSIYFGGGTPSFFGGEKISAIIKKIYECFDIDSDCEITVECNPSSVTDNLMFLLSEAGVNRISMGVQSAVNSERKQLGRRSDCVQTETAIALAKKHGITNISLDLMLGIPSQTIQTLDESLDFIIRSKVKHVSAYMLKIEESTPLYKNQNKLHFPDEDTVCDMYYRAIERLKDAGFMQYEISNFAVPGYESRHNVKYWNCEEYLGIGPSAHSFIDGKRFYYKRDIGSFISGDEPENDGTGGDEEEYIMLRLRLKDGIVKSEYFNRFGKVMPDKYINRAKKLQKFGLVQVNDESISLTEKGFLLSNSVIAEIMFD
ncbi:MAG: radical SAM family heme chaperone HemW [Faecalibacterium sp.]|nr:radical SAM family heme chaperone HemW [Ruminococcus sp.]MCM1391972.1 radical SAM family heme chaperone HemW [Ruminococcus sp.]MCM1485069.1 radical SAM family heme chaperone HemW [Faecalibacterium sp.]